MPQPDEQSLLCGRGRVLTLGTAVLAIAAAVVLAVGAQDARLLRLGLVAALWAALLAAFAAARMRCEISANAQRELRERADQAQRGEIAALRTELAAMRMNVEQLAGGQPLLERVTLQAEPTCLLPVVTLGVPAQAPRNISGITTNGSLGSAPGYQPAWEPGLVRNGKHDTSNQELPGLPNNGSPANGHHTNGHHTNGHHTNGHHTNGHHTNGHHINGDGTQRAAQDESVVGPQRSVRDLLAAHGGGSPPRRRHSREDGSRA